MNILFLMDVFIFGGCEKMLKEVTDKLIEDGYNVSLLLLYKSKSNTYLNMLNSDVKIYYLWDIDSCSHIKQRLVYWMNILMPNFVLRNFSFKQYDCLISFKDDYQINAICSKVDIPTISWVHNITEDFHKNEKKGIKFWLANIVYQYIYNRDLKLYTKFKHVVFVSKHARDALYTRCKGKVNGRVIYNYVDYQTMLHKSEEKIEEKEVFGELTFCYIGRLSAEKGVVEAVKAFCNIYKNIPNATFIIIGEGYQRKILEDYVQKNQCSDKIHFLGTKNNPYPYLKRSDVILCPSRKESFGLVVLEAILMDKYVVSTKCGGPEELIEHCVNGYLIDDINDLSNIMKNLYDGKINMIPQKSNVVDYKKLEENFYNQFYKLLKEIRGEIIE